MNVGTLTLEMAANVARLSRDMDAARKTVQKTFGSIEQDVNRLKNLLGGLGGTLAAAFSGRVIVETIDAYTKYTAQIKLATTSTEDFAKAQLYVKAIAQESQASISTVGQLYARISQSTEQLGVSQERVAAITRAVSLAMKVSGATAAESSSAMLQLSQAFSSGQLRGEEFNAVNEAAPRLMRALADGIGVPIGKLREMAKEGQITSGIMAEVLPKALQQLEIEAKSIQTISGAFQAFKNELLLFVGATGQANGVTTAFAKILGDLTTIMKALGSATGDANKQSETMKIIAEGLAITFEAVAVLGVNVSYVVEQIITELIGLSKQVKAIATLNFAEASRIRQEMVAAAEAARAQVDATTQRILNARKIVGQTFPAASEEELALRKTMDLMDGFKAKAAANAEEAKKFMTAFGNLRAKILGEVANVDADFYKNMELLRQGFKQGKISFEEYLSLAERYIKQQKFFQDEQKKLNDLYEDYAKANEDWAEAAEKERLERKKQIDAVKEMISEIEFEAKALQMTNEERQVAIKLREMERNGIIAGTAAYEEYAQKIREAVINKEDIETRKRFEEEYAKKYKETWTRINQEIGQSLTDAIMNGGKNAAKILQDLFKTLVLRPMMQPFLSNMTGGMQYLSGGAGGSGGGGGGGFGSALNFASTLISSANAFGTGMAAGFTNALTGTFAGSMQAAGALIGTGTAQGVAAGLGMGIGTVAPYVAAAVFAYDLLFGEELEKAGIRGTFKPGQFKGERFESYSGGLLGGGGTDTKALDAKTAAYFDQANQNLRNAAKLAAETLGGFSKSLIDFEYKIEINLMGKKTQEQRDKAIQDAFGKFDEALAKTVLTDLARGELFAAVKQSLVDVYKMKGAELALAYQSASEGVLGFLQFERNGKKYNHRLKITEKEIADYIATFQKAGETSKETLNRLSQSISVVNGVFSTLNLSMVEASLSGANLASQIADAFGGIEKFTQQTGYYYENFYSEAEKTAKTTETLTTAFSKLSLTLPATRQEFVSIIDSLDLTTEKGRETFAMLMMLAPAFASITSQVQDVNVIAEQMRQSAIDSAQTASNTALAILEQSISKQKQAAEIARDAAQAQVTAIKGLFDYLGTEIDSLRGVTGGMTSAAGVAFIDNAIAVAKASGYLPEANELSSAITAAKTGLDSGRFATEFDYKVAQASLANKLSELREQAGKQLTSAEKLLATQDAALTSLEEQLTVARDQLNAMRGLTLPIMTVTEAVNNMNSAMAAEMKALSASLASFITGLSPRTGTGGTIGEPSSETNDAAGAVTPTAKILTLVEAVKILQERGIAYGGQTGSKLKTTQDIANYFDADIYSSGGTLLKTAQFADGGLFNGGLRLVGEDGPELEVTGPARYFSAPATAAMIGGGESVAEELRNLRAENAAQSRAMVALQNRMTRLLERWDGDGLPEVRAVA